MSVVGNRSAIVRVMVAAAVLAWGVVIVTREPGAARASSSGGGQPQADSAKFRLWLTGEEHEANDTVYCGVRRNAEPYTLRVAVTNPARPAEGGNQNDGPFSPSHDGAGWLVVGLQDDTGPDVDGTYFNVPYNDSYSFELTLGGRPGVDQMVRLMSPPKGDDSGNGALLTGIVTVEANPGAIDPFDGDGRSDNFCVTVDADGDGSGEYTEGQIATALPVPGGWVTDDDGADGGFLRTLPH